MSLFKANRVFMEKSKSPHATPFYYGSKPLQSGWVSRENADAIKNSAAVISEYGRQWQGDQHCRQSQLPCVLARRQQIIFECDLLWKKY